MDSKKKLFGFVVILFVSIVLICSLPYLLTQYSIIDFSKTGQIGDTIGGIMGPFVGILTAILTFMAFWIQYQANEAQKSSIDDNKNEIKEQQQRYEINCFENKWLMLFDNYKETVKALRYNAEITGKAVFKEFIEELKLIYELVEYSYALFVKNELKYNTANSEIDFQAALKSDDKALRSFLTETAYVLFFYGSCYFSEEMIKEKTAKLVVMKQICKIATEMEYSISEKNIRSLMFNVKIGKTTSYKYQTPRSLFHGESYQLGHYFRVLYSLANYIDKSNVRGLDYKKKYEYFKLLRCQMSDEEQVLLYYNSISPMGLEWNTEKKNQDDILSIDAMGLIAKYRLVKNISPQFAFFGINPKEYYSQIEKYYEKHGMRFFEHDIFHKYESKVYVEKNINGDNGNRLVMKY